MSREFKLLICIVTAFALADCMLHLGTTKNYIFMNADGGADVVGQ